MLMPVTVCMAVHNGAAYLKLQLDSILEQIGPSDEVVIVDDASTDDSIGVIESIEDARIQIIRSDRNLGVNQAFARALGTAKNEVIFLADQDDLWAPARRSLMEQRLIATKALLLSGNQTQIDASGAPIARVLHRLRSDQGANHARNCVGILTGNTAYYGCCMVLRRSLLSFVLPIPDYVESHDLWIALAANLMHSNAHLDENVTLRRIHGRNASEVRRPLAAKLRSRFIHARSMLELKKRISQ
jgi:glycosyltransferase involved in cell wall biosynthesis